MKQTFRFAGRRASFAFDDDQPRDDHGRWTVTIDHGYEGESDHDFEGYREEIPAKVNEIIEKQPGGSAYVNHANVSDKDGNEVYRYSSRNGGEYVEPDEDSETASVEPAELVPVVAAVEQPRAERRFLRSDFAQAPQRLAAPAQPLSERMLETLSTALTALAAKPAQPISLQLAPSTVELVMPEQTAPVLHVEPVVHVHADAPQVDVHVPEQAAPQVLVAAAEAPQVIVNVPEQAPPVVNVTNENHVEVPQPRPVRVVKEAGGVVRYVPEDV